MKSNKILGILFSLILGVSSCDNVYALTKVPAKDVTVVASTYGKTLSTAATDVQKALDEINALNVGVSNITSTDNSVSIIHNANGVINLSVSTIGGVAWGDITGTLGNQTDLKDALDLKVPLSRTINGYDLGGDITLTKSDIGLGNVQDVDQTNASNLSSGTVNVLRLPSSVTLQGNSFNGASQLVQMTAATKLPAVDGSLLTGLTKTQVGLGNVENTALSTWAGSSALTTLGTIGTGVWQGTAIADAYIASAATWNAKLTNPMTTLGDAIYGGVSGAATRLAGNITTTRKFLRQTGDGAASAAPAWDTVTKTDVGLSNVPNTDATNASNISSGTLPDARLSSNITAQGNTFNGASQLLQMTAATKIPAVDGSLITNLTKTQVGLSNVENTALSTWAGSTSLTTLGTIATGVWNGTAITESYIGLSDVTTGNATTGRHGYLPKLSGTGTEFLNGSGTFSTPSGGGDVTGPATNSANFVPQWNGANSKTLKNGLAVGTSANNLVQLDGSALLPAVDGSALTGLTKSQVGLSAVENTALSTWAGTTNITTLGTIGTGSWNATNIPLGKGGTGAALTDPGANVLWGWDDTDNAIKFITIGSGLTYTHATHTLTSSGGGTGVAAVGNCDGPTCFDGSEGTTITGTDTGGLILTAVDASVTDADGAAVSLLGADANGDGEGGLLELKAGDAPGSNNGGTLNITSGSSNTGNAGDINITAGDPTGNIILTSGTGKSGQEDAGDITLQGAGGFAAGYGGDINLLGGSGGAGNTGGDIQLDAGSPSGNISIIAGAGNADDEGGGQIDIHAGEAFGSDTTGQAITIVTGLSTGSANGGIFRVDISPAGSSGSSSNSALSMLRVTADGATTLGSGGIDGKLIIYSEQGATDYTTTIQPGTQTQNIALTLPNDDGNANSFLQSNGSGVLNWHDLVKADIGLGNVENTALSTWAGTTNITTLGTIGTGTWQGTAVANAYLASVFSSKTIDNTNTVNLKDTLFTLQDDGDASKAAVFELAGITTGNTRTVTIANAASTTVIADTGSSNNFLTAISAAGVISKAQPSAANLSNGTTGSGSVVLATSPTLVTPVLGVASATSLATSAATPLLLTNGQLVNIALTSQTSGATTLTIPDFAGVADEFTFKTKSQTLSNKTFVAPVLGAATATTINKVTLTAPASGSTLTIADGKTLTISNSITLAGTDSTTMTFPTTSATIARTDAANTFTGHQTIEGVTSTGATGTGKFVFDGSPTLVTPTIGVATATSVNKLTLTAPATSATLTLVDGSSLITSGAFATTLTATATTNVTLPTTGTLSTLAGTETFTNKRNTPRVVTASDATSVTPNTDNADITYQANTQSTGTLTINADSGTPTNGQKWIFKIKSTNVQTFSWNSVFNATSDVALPTTSTGSSKYDYVGFIYNTGNSKWDCVAVTKGAS